MATTGKATKVFEGLRCPHCGEVDCLSVRLDDLVLSCSECSEDVTQAEVDAMVDQWRRLLGWIDAAATFADPM